MPLWAAIRLHWPPEQEVREAQLAFPFIKISAVQGRALDFEDSQHVIPLAVGSASACFPTQTAAGTLCQTRLLVISTVGLRVNE